MAILEWLCKKSDCCEKTGSTFSQTNLIDPSAAMLSLKKKKSRFKNSSLRGSSSSRLDSIKDRDYKVVMVCEEIPAANSSGFRHPGALSAEGSELHPATVQLSRESLTQRKTCCVEREPIAVHGITHRVYGYLLKGSLAQPVSCRLYLVHRFMTVT